MKLSDLFRDVKDMFLGTAMVDAVADVTPLLAEYRVRLQVIDRKLVRGQSEHVRLYFERDPDGTVSMAVGPLDSSISPEKSLPLILQVFAPDVRYVPGHGRSYRKTRDEVERLVGLLIKHCRPLLEGDFSAWPQVLELGEALWEREAEAMRRQ